MVQVVDHGRQVVLLENPQSCIKSGDGVVIACCVGVECSDERQLLFQVSDLDTAANEVPVDYQVVVANDFVQVNLWNESESRFARG